MKKILDRTDAENEFSLEDGWNWIMIGVRSGGSDSLPTSITLQRRFKDSDGTFTTWQDTKTVFGASYGWDDVVYGSSEVEYKLVASAMGAIAFTTPVASTKFI